MGWISKKWLESPSGRGNGENHADQLLSKVLKNLKYCCADVSLSWDIPESVVDYCFGFVTLISDFVGYLHTNWSLKSSGITDYTNPPGHLPDFPRSYSDLTKKRSSVFILSEIYIQQVKHYLFEKIKNKKKSNQDFPYIFHVAIQ